MRNPFLLALLSVFLFACGNENPLKLDVATLKIDSLKIKRYEKAMFAIPSDSFVSKVQSLQSEFPVFLDGDAHDTSAILGLQAFFQDPFMIDLNSMVQSKYPDLSEIEAQLNQSYSYLKHYFPSIKTPTTYTYVSGLDVESPVKYAIDNLIIGIDLYLGADAKPYAVSGFPLFKSKWMRKDRLVADCMEEIASGLMPAYNASGTLLDDMIYRGKQLYFTQCMLPEIQDSLLLKYSAQQVDFCTKYESKVWSMIIESNYLFEKNPTIKGKFMKDGPYSAFLAKESPARLGYYLGWKIVSNYMKNSKTILSDLMKMTDSQQILKESSYKPKL